MDLGYYYSAPSSPTHFLVSNAASPSAAAASGGSSSLDFDFSVTFPPTDPSSADELFCNGRIRPAKLSPNSLEPLIESDDAVAGERQQTPPRGSLRQRSRSMSSLRSASGEESEAEGKGSDETTSCAAGWRSRRWLFLKELLYRSKSEGRRNEGHNSKFRNTKRKTDGTGGEAVNEEPGKKSAAVNNSKGNNRKTGDGKNRGPAPTSTPPALRSASAHELHYTAKRAQTEEMRKKTFLPYRQGLLGCLGFRVSCKSFGAIDDFAGALCSR